MKSTIAEQINSAKRTLELATNTPERATEIAAMTSIVATLEWLQANREAAVMASQIINAFPGAKLRIECPET